MRPSRAMWRSSARAREGVDRHRRPARDRRPRAARDPIRSGVEVIRRAREHGVPVLAVDTPTAVDLTLGDPSDPVVRADVTVTFHRPKTGLLTRVGKALAGQGVRRADRHPHERRPWLTPAPSGPPGRGASARLAPGPAVAVVHRGHRPRDRRALEPRPGHRRRVRELPVLIAVLIVGTVLVRVADPPRRRPPRAERARIAPLAARRADPSCDASSSALQDGPWDVLIVGGGIVGAGALLDADQPRASARRSSSRTTSRAGPRRARRG